MCRRGRTRLESIVVSKQLSRLYSGRSTQRLAPWTNGQRLRYLTGAWLRLGQLVLCVISGEAIPARTRSGCGAFDVGRHLVGGGRKERLAITRLHV
jgi:hypothetical protein